MKLTELSEAKQFIIECEDDKEYLNIQDVLQELVHNFEPVYMYLPSRDNDFYIDFFDTLEDAIKAAQDEVEDNVTLGQPISPYYTFYQMSRNAWNQEIAVRADIPHVGKELMRLRPDLTFKEY